MSDKNAQSLAENGGKSLTPVQEVNDVLKTCEFGIFHIKLLLSTFVGYIAGVLVSNTTSFLLPSAECDLSMDLVQKGLLNAIPYIGMMFSTIIAGFLVDTFGRRKFIIYSLAGNFIITVIAGCSQTYAVLITAKFFEGILFATYFSAGLTLTSEFCHDSYRDRIMMIQASFASMAIVIISAMSWVILPNDWKVVFFGGKFVLNTWNFYLFIVSMWSFVGCILYFFVPESPKFLVTQKKYSEARNILIKIYETNTKKSVDTFPHKDIWRNLEYIQSKEPGNDLNKNIAHQIVVGLHNIKPMFRKPLLFYLILISTMNFMIMTVYNVSRLWYPQVSTIVEHLGFTTADGTHRNLCQMLDNYTFGVEAERFSSNATVECVTHKSGAETYINSMIIGSVCLLPYLLCVFLVNKFGKKALITSLTLICMAAMLGLRWASSNVVVVTLFAAGIAIPHSLMSLNQLIVVEFFPTTARTLGISMMMMIGRIGTLIGNILFPVMLKMGCSIPFYTLAAALLCVFLLSLLLPTKKTSS